MATLALYDSLGNTVYSVEATNTLDLVRKARAALIPAEFEVSDPGIFVFFSAGELEASGVSLAGEPLSGMKFNDANLAGLDLSGVGARGTDFNDANLRGTDFTGADLRGADLHGADVTGADFTNADLRGARLWRTSLAAATTTGADLEGADLDGRPN